MSGFLIIFLFVSGIASAAPLIKSATVSKGKVQIVYENGKEKLIQDNGVDVGGVDLVKISPDHTVVAWISVEKDGIKLSGDAIFELRVCLIL